MPENARWTRLRFVGSGLRHQETAIKRSARASRAAVFGVDRSHGLRRFQHVRSRRRRWCAAELSAQRKRGACPASSLHRPSPGAPRTRVGRGFRTFSHGGFSRDAVHGRERGRDVDATGARRARSHPSIARHASRACGGRFERSLASRSRVPSGISPANLSPLSTSAGGFYPVQGDQTLTPPSSSPSVFQRSRSRSPPRGRARRAGVQGWLRRRLRGHRHARRQGGQARRRQGPRAQVRRHGAPERAGVPRPRSPRAGSRRWPQALQAEGHRQRARGLQPHPLKPAAVSSSAPSRKDWSIKMNKKERRLAMATAIPVRGCRVLHDRR